MVSVLGFDDYLLSECLQRRGWGGGLGSDWHMGIQRGAGSALGHA